jgi:hypothetical protein
MHSVIRRKAHAVGTAASDGGIGHHAVGRAVVLSME